MNGKPAENIDVEIVATTNNEILLVESDAAGRVKEDRTNQLGHARFVVDVPKIFTISYLKIKVCNPDIFISLITQ